ncbi:hypothetical protein B4U80_07132 [Leptotrombidium deliense]|uniref:Uncharacterized protein n=1 Tax=Leptotrombidium deliense TaxID=299467 RepID=A0A443SEX0_9ACAR|nr:hypothetical protein B4U80_07132 [Leptotrombidium deliense]
MKQEYQNALAKGLPFPILTIAEYLSQSGEGFCWGRRYRLAGYYSTILLWVAFSSWILMNILLCAVPRYGVFAMQITGAIMLLANAVYAILLPRKPLSIPFEGGTLAFSYGWCFWINLIAGVIALLVGATVSIIDTLFPNKFSTILEVDYDTPYRYFVGNDAHLFGGLAMINANTCPHISQSNTNSAVTESTCCIASSTRGHSKSNLTVGSGTVSSKILTSKRSDASVSTVMSIPVKGNSSLQKQKSDAIDSKQVTTTADIELTNVGIENKAFEKEHDSHDSDSSEVSTTIIDGKRAVSLANFGKFQRQQTIEAQKEGRVPTTPNTANTAFWY